MAKKKNNSNASQTTQINLNNASKYPNKYIGVIKEIVKDEHNIDEMIRSVSVINAQLVALSISEEKVRKERDLIIEAYNYAAERMLTSEKNERKILENWFGNWPLLFRMGSILEYEKDKERIDFEYTLLSDEQKILFKKILDATWKVREKRRISLCGNAVQIPKTVRKDELQQYYYAVKDRIITFLLSDNDVLTFALERPDGDVISALLKKNGKIEVVDAKRLEHSYSYDAFTGKYMGHHDGEKYVEFNIVL
jgi:hypothetical protein